MSDSEPISPAPPTDPPPNSRPPWWKRRPARLSVRALMLVVVAVACGLGWWAHLAQVQRDAIAAIERAGGKVYYGWQLRRTFMPPDYGDLTPHAAGQPRWPKWITDRVPPDYYSTATLALVRGPADALMPEVGRLANLQEIDFFPSGKPPALGPTDAGMPYLEGLTDLRHLKLGVHMAEVGAVGSKITGKGLKAIRGLTRLQFLELEGIPLVDADLEALAGLTDLRHLDMDSPEITDAGLAHLAGLDQLRNLTIINSKVTSVGADHLKGLGRLERLTLAASRVEALEPFRRLPALTTLVLAASPVGDAGLAPASDAGFPALTVLNLSKTRVHDAGLAHLKALPKLRSVFLVGTDVTDAGVAEFQQGRRISVLRRMPPATPRPPRAAKKAAPQPTAPPKAP